MPEPRLPALPRQASADAQQDQFAAGAKAMRNAVIDMLWRKQRMKEARLVGEMPLPVRWEKTTA